MPSVPRNPRTVSTDASKIGYAPSVAHWNSISKALNWLHGDGGCCLPHMGVDLTILTSASETYPVALRSRPGTTGRLWIVNLFGISGPVREGTFTDFSGGTHQFQALQASEGRHLFYFLEDCGPQAADMAVQTGTIGVEHVSGGTIGVASIAAYDLGRPELDGEYPDLGVEPPGGAGPIIDANGKSVGGILEATSYARRHAARTGLFSWLVETGSPQTVVAGNDLFLAPPLIMPRRVADSTVSGVTFHVYCKLASAGSATIRAQTDFGGDTDTASVTSTSYAWYTLGPIDAGNEDSTANSNHGARANTPFGEIFDVSVDGGGQNVDFAAVYVHEEPAAAFDMWTPQRLGEDDVRIWLDPENLLEVDASGNVTAWECPITGTAATLVNTPTFVTADATFANRSTVRCQYGSSERVTVPGIGEPTSEGLTAYFVCEWFNTPSGTEILIHNIDLASGGWALIDSGSGLFVYIIDGSVVARNSAPTSVSYPSGPVIARFSIDGNSGSLTAGCRVNRGTEQTVSFTGYTGNALDELKLFYLDASNYGDGSAASLVVIDRYIADGSDEDDRIMTALEARFGI